MTFDITERKLQEEELRKSELLLDRTGRMAGIGGWEVDLVTGVVVWSRETRRIHGVDDDYVPDLPTAFRFYPPEVAQRLEIKQVNAKAGPTLCGALCLEITETAAVTNIGDAAAFIDQVREHGVKVALDDFGAGAASFGYLKTLRVDTLKIDGQFVRDLVDDPLDEVAVRCFADVAKVMGLTTVAEFVDKPAVLERLHAMGVDFAQGFLLHEPVPIDQLLEAAPAAA